MLNLLRIFFATGLSVGLTSIAMGDHVIAGDWQTVQKRGRLVVGVKSNLPPMGFKDPSGNLIGFEIDIAKELAKELLGSDQALEFLPVSNRDRLPSLWADRIDLLIAQLTVSQNRARLVDFTLPYYTDGTVLIARRGISREQLQTKSAIAVLKNSATIAVLQSTLPQADLIGVESYQAGFDALKSDKVQAFAGDASATAYWLSQNTDFSRVGELLAVQSLAIAMPRGLQYTELRQKVSKVVEKWRKTGWLRSRANAWGLP